MRKNLTAVTFMVIMFLLSCHASESRAQQARTTLHKAMKAYGKWETVKTLEYEVSGTRDAGAQGKIYKSGEKQAYAAKRIYDLEAKKLYETNLNKFPGGYAFYFATAVQDTTAINYDLDGTRNGRLYNKNGKAIAESRYKVGQNHIAYLKLQDLVQTPDSLLLQLPDTGSYIVIRKLTTQKAPLADYFFSRKTKLLEKVRSEQSGQKLELQYRDYTTTAGRKENSTVTLIANGKATYEERIKIKRANFTFDDKLLETPKGYTQNKAPSVSKPKEIAKDIYLIERLAGDRNILFVNMDEYIAVIEAPINSELSKQVISMIRAVVPDKPINFVFTTHFHSDHTGGLRQYAHEGATLLMTKPTQEYVKELLAAQQPDDLGKSGNGTPVTFQNIDNKFVLQDTNHLIEFYEVPNSHAEGMALVYFPTEKLIYQGDLLSVPLDGTLPFAIEVTQDMQRFLNERNLSFIRMIGHHGHNDITPSMLNQIMQRIPAR